MSYFVKKVLMEPESHISLGGALLLLALYFAQSLGNILSQSFATVSRNKTIFYTYLIITFASCIVKFLLIQE